MLYFSYKFFLYSFYSTFLKKYSRTFFFHLICKFNLIVFNFMYNIVYYLFQNNNFFYLYLIKIRDKYLFSNISLLSCLVFFIYVYLKLCIQYLYVYNFLFIPYIQLMKFFFLLKNYNNCLLKNYLYVQILDYVKNVKNNMNLFISDFSFVVPVAKKIITILKSPHVHKKARDQYFFKMHKVGFALKNLFIFYPKIFYLNSFNNLSIKLQRKLHLL